MNDNEVRYRLSAYNWAGKLIDSDQFIAADELEVVNKADDWQSFMLEIFENVQEGEYES